MAQPWILCPSVEPSPELLAAVGGHPLVARLLAQRGLDTPAKAIPFLDPDQYQPAPPTALLGVDEAARLLHTAIAKGQNFLIWGDFDVDGQTSTALLVTALRALARDDRVRFHVPNRFEESHGIKVEKLKAILAAADIPIHLLLSCDTGITEGPAVGFAKEQGLTVVITDHHDLAAELHGLQPDTDPLWGLDAATVGRQSVRRADAIVNPKFLPPGDPLRTLPGVGVAYKLVQRLYELAGRSGEEEELLDLVALGIVADVAEQVHDARYLLQRGLARLRTTRRAGLLALMNVARIDPALLSADSIGFQLGPRMNALGRLEDATVSVELLTTHDAIRAGQLAAKLERLNQERRSLTSQTARAAHDLVERDPSLLTPNAIVLAHPNWHAGVVGIVASKMVEEFGKPVVLLLTPPGEPARGSARSVPGVDIGSAIAACHHLLIAHGGHPGAAGVSLLPDNIAAFRRELSRQVELYRDPDVQTGLLIDAVAPLEMLNLDLAVDLTRLAPFGSGNPAPQLASYGLEVVEDRRMGREGTHRRLNVRTATAPEGGPVLPVVWFGGADTDLPVGPIDLVYTLNINEYKGERTLQLRYVASRPAQLIELAGGVPVAPAHRRIHDWRQQPVLREQLPDPGIAAWYAEGAHLESTADGVTYAPRWQLAGQPAGQPLVIWSIPPASDVLQWLVEATEPAEIHLCATRTNDDTLHAVLHTIARMCKYALQHDNLLYLDRMAARLGVTEGIIRNGLLWLEARGEISLVEWQHRDTLRIAAGNGSPRRGEVAIVQEILEEQLAEVRAYRRFFQRATIQELNINAI